MRTFATGATRDADDNKIDPEGFLSPLALQAFCEYMHSHRKQPDGNLRDSDNWQKGMPVDAYIKSLLRHVLDLWLVHRGFTSAARSNKQEALCAILFNAQGYLHEVIKKEAITHAHLPVNPQGYLYGVIKKEELNDKQIPVNPLP